MKMIAEYLERAHQFERMAAEATDLELKARFTDQAIAYRELAEKRAETLGMPLLEPPRSG